MLVLSRRRGEKVNIYVEQDGARVVIGSILLCDIRGDKVRLGIDLPKNFTILRPEIDSTSNGENTNGKA